MNASRRIIFRRQLLQTQMKQWFHTNRILYFNIVPTTESDQARVLNLLKTDFSLDEPLCRSLGCGFGQVEEAYLREIIGNGYTLMALEKETGKVVGASLIDVHTKEFSDNYGVAIAECEKYKDYGYANTLRLFQQLEQKSHFWDKIGTDRCLRAVAVTVDRRYRKRNIGRKLLEKSESMGRELTFIRGESTNPISMKILRSQGWQTIYKYNIRDYLDAEGRVIFPTEYPNTHIYLACKRL